MFISAKKTWYSGEYTVMSALIKCTIPMKKLPSSIKSFKHLGVERNWRSKVSCPGTQKCGGYRMINSKTHRDAKIEMP